MEAAGGISDSDGRPGPRCVAGGCPPLPVLGRPDSRFWVGCPGALRKCMKSVMYACSCVCVFGVCNFL
jgi:hypothetical protein